jgi:hypothetical protein
MLQIETKSEGIHVNYYVIGGVLLAMAMLVAYQMFGCAGCYAPI